MNKKKIIVVETKGARKKGKKVVDITNDLKINFSEILKNIGIDEQLLKLDCIDLYDIIKEVYYRAIEISIGISRSLLDNHIALNLNHEAIENIIKHFAFQLSEYDHNNVEYKNLKKEVDELIKKLKEN